MPDSALNFDRPRLTDRSTNPHNSPTPQKGAERAANIPTRSISQLMDGMRREFDRHTQAADPAGSIARAPVAGQGHRSGNRSDKFSRRLAAFYATFFGFSGIVMPFFPAWLQAKGLDSRAPGIVLAVPMFMRLISVPSLARLADRRSAFRGALISTAIGSASAYLVLSQVSGFATTSS
jgi:hypothetical protein